MRYLWWVWWFVCGAAIAASAMLEYGPSRPAAPAPAPVVDTMPALAILYRGEVYTVIDIQLAPDGKTFLAQFRTAKKVKTRRTK